jgi:hypothetical protein
MFLCPKIPMPISNTSTAITFKQAAMKKTSHGLDIILFAAIKLNKILIFF